MKRNIVLVLLLCCTFLPASAQLRTNPKDQSEELGTVSWYRNYEAALELSEQEGKPVLVLFQEVPGCMTCRNYGQNVLSHPLMVEAIEHEFIPLAIYNNKGGADRKVLEMYDEPSWNNPVVRIVDAKGENLVSRVARNYSALGLFEAMARAMVREGRQIPGYMQVLGEELRAQGNANVQEAYFQMYCFWSGEAHLGTAPGVVSTEPGFMSGREVVKVRYDGDITSAEQLAKHGKSASCAPIAKSSFRSDKDPQYYLKKSAYRNLPLTPLQKTRINSALGKGGDPQVYLSPTQKQWLKDAKKGKSGSAMYTMGFANAWQKMQP